MRLIGFAKIRMEATVDGVLVTTIDEQPQPSTPTPPSSLSPSVPDQQQTSSGAVVANGGSGVTPSSADAPQLLGADDEKKLQQQQRPGTIPGISQQQQQQAPPPQGTSSMVANGSNNGNNKAGGEVYVIDGHAYTKRRPVPLPPNATVSPTSSNGSGSGGKSPTTPTTTLHSPVQQQQSNSSIASQSQSQSQPFTLKLGFVNAANGRYLTSEKFGNRLNVTATSLKQRQMWTLEIAAADNGNGNGNNGNGSATMTSSMDSNGSSSVMMANDIVYLKSAGGCYLAANVKGAVSCDSTERTPDSQFVIEFERSSSDDAENNNSNGGTLTSQSSALSLTNNNGNGPSGRWAIRNVVSGAYLGVWTQRNINKHQDEQPDTLQCRIDKTALVGDSELWYAQLSATPMVHLRNYGRNRYAHLNNDGAAFICNDIVPWGHRSIVLLEFYEGKYAIRSAANNKYLHREGGLVPCLSRDSLFSLEFKTCVGMQQLNGVVFRDVTGACLCASGVGMLRCSIRKTITKDELFSISESQPQVTLINVANQKYVSIKQGMDVSANQLPMEPDPDSPPSFLPYSTNEIFQLEIDRASSKWLVLSSKNKLWSLNAGGAKAGVTANADDRLSPDCQFDAVWHDVEGSVSLKANNGCFVKANPTGALQATTNSQPSALTDREKFYVDVVNRPLTVFRGAVGFIGLLTGSSVPNSKQLSQRLDCSRVVHDVFELVRQGPAVYAIKAVNGKYWRVADGDLSVVADCDDEVNASWFRFEFRRYGRATIRHVENPSGAGLLLLIGEQSGMVVAKGRDVNDNTLWEM